VHVIGVFVVQTPGVVRSVVTAVPFNAGFALELTRVMVTEVEFGLTYCGFRLELDVVEPGFGRTNVNFGVTYVDCGVVEPDPGFDAPGDELPPPPPPHAASEKAAARATRVDRRFTRASNAKRSRA
jgi:hypothetical protein